MVVRKQALFLLLLVLCGIQAEVAQQKIVKRRSGFEPFNANQGDTASNPEAFEGSTVTIDDGSKDLAQARKLSQNRNVQNYFSMINSGRPVRPDRRSPRHQGDECTLFAEFNPLYYNLLSRSSDFTMAFSSNCLRYVEIGFKMNYKKSRLVNWFMHPTTIHLNLWGNSYKIRYGRRKLIDKFDIVRAFEYSQATVSHLLEGKVSVNTRQKNSIYLDPQAHNTFNKFNIQKLLNVRGRVNCEMGIRRVKGWKVRMAKRNRFIKLMKDRGETEKAIRKMLNRKNFSPIPERRRKAERKLSQGAVGQQNQGAIKNPIQKTNQKRKRSKNNKKKVKQSKKGNSKIRKSKPKDTEMTPDERRIYGKNRDKMRLRYKREFVRRVEIECVIV